MIKYQLQVRFNQIGDHKHDIYFYESYPFSY